MGGWDIRGVLWLKRMEVQVGPKCTEAEGAQVGYQPPWSKFPMVPLQPKQEPGASQPAGSRTRLPGLVVLFTFHVFYSPTSECNLTYQRGRLWGF